MNIYLSTFYRIEDFLANRLSTENQKAFIKEIACLHTSKELKAIAMFTGISSNSGFYEDALWDMALIYLKIKQEEKCILKLEDIIDYNGKYQSKASILKDKIDTYKSSPF